MSKIGEQLPFKTPNSEWKKIKTKNEKRKNL